MLSPRIARELRNRGHDVIAVKERPDLIGLRDREIVRRMAAERRVIVTNDVDDFIVIARRLAASGEEHLGILFTFDQSLPRNRASVPHFVSVLHTLLEEHPAEDALRNRTRALP